MSYTLVLEWMPGDLYMSAVTARCTAPTSSYSIVWLPPNKVYQITLYCGSTSLVSFLVGAFRGKAWSYMRKIIFCMTLALMLCVILSGCNAKSNSENEEIDLTGFQQIYTEEMSPNEAYVTSKDDIVYYYINIYQDKNNTILVDTSSNTRLVEDQSYTIDYDKQIEKDDVKVTWTTFMGNPEATEDDQLVVADIAISSNGEVFSERKVNFAKGVLEIIVDVIDNNQ